MEELHITYQLIRNHLEKYGSSLPPIIRTDLQNIVNKLETRLTITAARTRNEDKKAKELTTTKSIAKLYNYFVT